MEPRSRSTFVGKTCKSTSNNLNIKSSKDKQKKSKAVRSKTLNVKINKERKQSSSKKVISTPKFPKRKKIRSKSATYCPKQERTKNDQMDLTYNYRDVHHYSRVSFGTSPHRSNDYSNHCLNQYSNQYTNTLNYPSYPLTTSYLASRPVIRKFEQSNTLSCWSNNSSSPYVTPLKREDIRAKIGQFKNVKKQNFCRSGRNSTPGFNNSAETSVDPNPDPNPDQYLYQKDNVESFCPNVCMTAPYYCCITGKDGLIRCCIPLGDCDNSQKGLKKNFDSRDGDFPTSEAISRGRSTRNKQLSSFERDGSFSPRESISRRRSPKNKQLPTFEKDGSFSPREAISKRSYARSKQVSAKVSQENKVNKLLEDQESLDRDLAPEELADTSYTDRMRDALGTEKIDTIDAWNATPSLKQQLRPELDKQPEIRSFPNYILPRIPLFKQVKPNDKYRDNKKIDDKNQDQKLNDKNEDGPKQDNKFDDKDVDDNMQDYKKKENTKQYHNKLDSKNQKDEKQDYHNKNHDKHPGDKMKDYNKPDKKSSDIMPFDNNPDGEREEACLPDMPLCPSQPDGTNTDGKDQYLDRRNQEGTYQDGKIQERGTQDGAYQDGRNPDGTYQNGKNQDGRNKDGKYQDGRYQDGRNKDGRNQDGRNQDGRYQDGRNQDGKNRDGRNQDGRNPDGTYQNGKNQDGRNQDGKNQDGRNQDSRNQDGRNQDGRYQDGRYQDGKNQDGRNQDGKNRDGRNQDGRNPDGTYQKGKNQDGRNQDGRNQVGRYQDGRYQDGKNQDGRNRDGRNQDGRNPDGTYQNGKNQDGRDQDGKYQDGRNQDGRNQDERYQDGRYQDGRYQDDRYQDGGYQDGKNQDGINRDGRNQDGRNRDGRNQDGRYQDGSYQDGRNLDGKNPDGIYQDDKMQDYDKRYDENQDDESPDDKKFDKKTNVPQMPDREKACWPDMPFCPSQPENDPNYRNGRPCPERFIPHCEHYSSWNKPKIPSFPHDEIPSKEPNGEGDMPSGDKEVSVTNIPDHPNKINVDPLGKTRHQFPGRFIKPFIDIYKLYASRDHSSKRFIKPFIKVTECNTSWNEIDLAPCSERIDAPTVMNNKELPSSFDRVDGCSCENDTDSLSFCKRGYKPSCEENRHLPSCKICCEKKNEIKSSIEGGQHSLIFPSENPKQKSYSKHETEMNETYKPLPNEINFSPSTEDLNKILAKYTYIS